MTEGLWDGALDGALDAPEVGPWGDFVGNWVEPPGAFVGGRVGAILGTFVGVFDGDLVGVFVGLLVVAAVAQFHNVINKKMIRKQIL